MSQKIGYVALVVRDYDEAIAYYTSTLGFNLIEDTDLGGGKRRVLVTPPGSTGTRCCSHAATPEQATRVGNQTGGRVFLFLHTDDFWRDYNELKSRNVNFTENPRHESYGTVVIFEDIYGNRWDLIQLRLT